MPIYEYRCQSCGRKNSVFWRSLAAMDESKVRCERCGSPRLARVVSKVRVMRGGSSASTDGNGYAGGTDGGDDALMNEMAGLDENDPRALGRFMRKMSAESGEDLGPEFDEVIGRLEKGEDPEKIEQEMGDVFGDGPAGGMGMDGMGGMGGMGDDYAAPEDATATADKAAEAKDKKATEKRRTVAMKGKGKAPKKTAKAAKPSAGKRR